LACILAAGLGACVEGQYVWQITKDEGAALRLQPAVGGDAAAAWSVQCDWTSMVDEPPCTIQSAPGPDGRAVVVWPDRDLVAVYGSGDPTLQSATQAVTPGRCFVRAAKSKVCVFEPGPQGDLVTALRQSATVQLQVGSASEALPGGYAGAEARYVREMRDWRNRSRMDPSGSGGAGGAM
jgi:hypothetical protein